MFVELLEMAFNESSMELKSSARRKKMTIEFKFMCGDETKVLLFDDRLVYGAARYAVRARIVWQKARRALTRGRLEEFYKHVAVTEGFLGFATGMRIAKEVVGITAGIKAKKRHAQTYAMREQAIHFWRTEVDPSLSAAKAAEYISEMYFAKLGKEISYRTLAEWIAAEKKKPQASTGKNIN